MRAAAWPRQTAPHGAAADYSPLRPLVSPFVIRPSVDRRLSLPLAASRCLSLDLVGILIKDARMASNARLMLPIPAERQLRIKLLD